MPLQLTTRRLLAGLAVVVTASVFYLPAIDDYFVQDDYGVVWLLSQKPPLHFPRWFAEPWMEDIWGFVPDEIRPFPALSYQVASYVGAGSPVPNHLLNITLHALNALLVVWLAVAAAGLAWPAATFAGLVFAVLPIQNESVAWITGRVDTLPALFYLASFALYVRWRANAMPSVYVWSLLLCFLALFSKQNTITLVPALVMYDLMIARVPDVGRNFSSGSLLRWLRPYVPYVLLTIGFLLLRYILFREFAREGLLTSDRFVEYGSDVARHLKRLVYGDWYMDMPAGRAMALAALGIAVIWVLGVRRGHSPAPPYVRDDLRGPHDRHARRPGPDSGPGGGAALYFGVVWMVLGIAPILVAGYFSPRHMYIASVGWAIVVGLAFNRIWTSDAGRPAQAVSVALGVAMLAFYSVQLTDVVRDWGVRAEVSERAVLDVEREAAAAPAGTLMIVGVPASSWRFALPFSTRPPFTRSDLPARVLVISDASLHCCPPPAWEEYTRDALAAWQSNPDRPPVMALSWNERTAGLSLVKESDRPDLRPLVDVLLRTSNWSALDRAIRSLLSEVALTAPAQRPQ